MGGRGASGPSFGPAGILKARREGHRWAQPSGNAETESAVTREANIQANRRREARGATARRRAAREARGE